MRKRKKKPSSIRQDLSLRVLPTILMKLSQKAWGHSKKIYQREIKDVNC